MCESSAAVFNSIGMLYMMMEEVVYVQIGNIARDLGTIQNYVDFLELEERKGQEDEAPEWGDIEFDHVSFTYPGAKKQAVVNVSFTLKKGETIAVVGENGSGKSTLIRLLSGLYLPDLGNVYMSGKDTAELTANALYQSTSAVFQKFQKYQMTLEENIEISRSFKKIVRKELDDICRMAGVEKDSETFPNGYDTMLSREFDGADLSGGQWQRVVIARGFFRDHNLIILDEPTAAIDPYEKTRIYNQFSEISKDKSAVIVTHRLGSVKLADKIIVMKEGQVSQIGTHMELIGVEGEYKRLYLSQEKWYQGNL